MVLISVVLGLAVAPAAADACTSLRGVTGFHGHTSIDFTATAGGQDVGNGGTYMASLDRSLSSVEVRLTSKKVTRRLGVVEFTGRASGGNVMVNDTFQDSGANWQGAEQYSGQLTNKLPSYGTAVMFAYPRPCKYQLEVAFGVQTAFSGNAPSSDPQPTVTGYVQGAEEPVSRSLKLSGDIDPDAYWGGSCPKSGLQEGVFACYGGFGEGAVGLCGSFDLVAANCGGPGDERLTNGTRTFAWHLSPTFSPHNTK